MNKFRVNLKKKMDKYIKLNGISYEYFNRVDEVRSLSGIVQNGGTTFKTLFQASKFLNIDIRNFLMFSDNTYVFKSSFETFEDFFVFLGKKIKNFRQNKKLRAVDIANKINVNIDTVFGFENARRGISLDKFYGYLEALEITSDDFFLKDEKYKIMGNKIKNQISIDNFNNRIYELEEIKCRVVGGDIYVNPNNFPTLHGFLKICKKLRVSPKDFFDFEKKEFGEDFKVVDSGNLANFIKQKLKLNGVKVQRYIKLDSIFLFCNENNIDIKDFFDDSTIIGNLNQIGGNLGGCL